MAKYIFFLTLFVELCISVPVNIVPTLELKRRLATASSLHRRAVTRQVADLDASTHVTYSAEVTFGEQTFELEIDTGSSDTWAVNQNFTCTSGAGTCHYEDGYDWPGTFQEIEGVNLHISYQDGTDIVGPLGYEDVTIAGVTVPSQVVSIADTIYATTDTGSPSGLIGLGYSALTHAVNSTTGATVSYDSIVTSMFNAGLTSTNSFTLALSTDGGKLAFGGLPSGVTYQPPWATVPIVQQNGIYSEYRIDDVRWAFEGAQNYVGSNGVLIDSGTTFNYVPTDIAAAVNGLFQPPATLTSNGLYSVDCDAKVPSFGALIGGVEFLMRSEDMISGSGTNCLSTIGGSDTIKTLGDVFLRSVIAVFDVGNEEMQFAAST
jgi:hypothetical protein